MTLYLLDTDTLSLFWRGHPEVTHRLGHASREELAITIVTVEEVLFGWQDQTRRARTDAERVRAYQYLADSVPFLASFRIISYDEASLARLAELRALKLNLGAMDTRIGAIAQEKNAVVVTRNQRDFSRIPRLRIEDWSQPEVSGA